MKIRKGKKYRDRSMDLVRGEGGGRLMATREK